MSSDRATRVVILGGSYAGIACIKKLLSHLPKNKDVVITLVEKCDARYHCIASYRALVQKDFARNVWIPYTNLFPKDSPHRVVRGTVESIFRDHILLSGGEPSSDITLLAEPGQDYEDPRRIDFDFLVIATGSVVPAPAKWNVSSSAEGLKLLEKTQQDIKECQRIVCIGGGASGTEFVSEMKYAYPDKSVTLIHEGPSLVNYSGYPQSFKDEARRYLEKEGVQVFLNERAEIEGLSRENPIQRAERTIKLKGSNMTIQSDLQFFSIGMSVQTGFLSTLRPPVAEGRETNDKFNTMTMLDPKTKAILVKPTMQLKSDVFSNIFAIGDISNADPVPTCQAAMAEGEVCARNIAKLIHKRGKEREEGGSEGETDGYVCRSWSRLEEYVPSRPLMVLAMNPCGGVTHLPVLGTWFGGLGAWLVKSSDLFSARFWREMNMPRP